MSAVIEFRTYRARPARRDALLELLRRRAFPIQRKLGMKLLGPFPREEDDVTFVWIRAFPDEASREPLRAAFYEGDEWLDSLESEILPMLDGYAAIVVSDTEGLWDRWPGPAQ